MIGQKSYIGIKEEVVGLPCGNVADLARQFADDKYLLHRRYRSVLCLTRNIVTACSEAGHLSIKGRLDDQLKEKRFLRFGRALSGDGFLRFGRSNYPFEDKRFLRFGRGDRPLSDLLREVSLRVQNFEKTNGARLRRKRSAETEPIDNYETSIEKVEDIKRSVDAVEEDGKDKRFMRFGKKDDTESDEKRFMRNKKQFMRFGRENEDGEDLDKRFMRFGKAGDEKRFMRFGRDPEIEGDDDEMKEEPKRFMRFGKSDDEKRFMRFGRGDDEKRFMRFGKKSDDKRFMRFGRDPDNKRFMRFGRGNDAALDKKSNDKRFMRFGKK